MKFNRKPKLTALLLALIMLFTAIPASVFTAFATGLEDLLGQDMEMVFKVGRFNKTPVTLYKNPSEYPDDYIQITADQYPDSFTVQFKFTDPDTKEEWYIIDTENWLEQSDYGYVAVDDVMFDTFPGTGSAIGSVAKITAASVDLYTSPLVYEDDYKAAAFLTGREVVIKNYCMNPETGDIWYQIDAIPGETWPEEYESYRYIAKDDVQITANGKIWVTVANSRLRSASSQLTMYAYDKIELTAATSLQGQVKYKWQVFAEGAWIDIHGENSSSVVLTYGILAGVVNDRGQSLIRPVAQSAAKYVEGDTITVTMTEDEAASVQMPASSASSASSASAPSAPSMASAGEALEEVTVQVQFVFQDGSFASDPVTFTVPANSTDQAPGRVNIPRILGYEPVLMRDGHDGNGEEYTDSTYDVDLNGLTANETIRFVYYPALVNYTILYYIQNADDDGYTLYADDTPQGYTGDPIDETLIEAETALLESIFGNAFKQLPYAKLENGIAANGSTVVEVYYDRLYYLMLFDLDGGYGVQPIYARYGTPIVIDNPAKPGHLFVGWDDVTADGTGDKNEDWLPYDMPAYDSKYRAMWKAEEVAKVSVVIWGENPNDDDYSYMADESFEFYAKPGSELTFGTGYKCGLTNHTHTEACGPICEKAEHIHGESCYDPDWEVCEEIIHAHSEEDCGLRCMHTTHELECYRITNTNQYELRENTSFDPTDYDSSANLGNGIYTYTNEDWWGDTTTYYYVKIGEKWYTTYSTYNDNLVGTRTITLNCQHTHSDACYDCGMLANDHQHSWQEGCYGLICWYEYHVHNDEECYVDYEHTHTDACSMQITEMDSALWTLKSSDTVTVEADGSTVLNVYYDRTVKTLTFHYNYSRGEYTSTYPITAKWGADISAEYAKVVEDAGTTFWSKTTDADGPYTNYFGIMPNPTEPVDGDDKVYYDYYHREDDGSNGTMSYYGQDFNGEYTILLFECLNVGGYTVTAEDRYEFEGYTYSHGTSNGSSCAGAKFYYTRNSYNLVYNDGFGEIANANKVVPFGAPLDEYEDYTPPIPEGQFEDGSVMFGGWYSDPDCTQRFVFDGKTMPASDITVYAKWTPVTHTVTFYQDLADKIAGKVYSGKDQNGNEVAKFLFEVTHGDLIIAPNVPPADPTKGQYEFIGWFYDDGHGNEYVWDFENSHVTHDIDLYGKWSSATLADYTVRYVYAEQTGTDADGNPVYTEIAELAAPTTGSMLGGHSKTFIAKDVDDFYPAYQTGGYYFPTEQSHTITIDLEDETQNTKIFYYLKRDAVPYTVEHHYMKDGVEDASLYQEEYYPDNVKAVITAHYRPKAGWVPQNGVFQQTLVIDADNPENNVVKFYYIQDTQNGIYRIEYYLETTEDGVYELDESLTFYGMRPVGEIARVGASKEIPHFDFNTSHPLNVNEAVVVAGTEVVLKQYYDRYVYTYDIYFLEEGTNKIIRDPLLNQNALYMAQPDIPDYYIEGYTFTRHDPEIFIISRDNMIINLYYRRSTAHLTIQKEGHDTVDVNQSYIFDMVGVEGTSTAGLRVTVTVHGNGKITVADVPVGKYTVTERSDWSWRYQSTGVRYTGDTFEEIKDGNGYVIGATVEITGEKDTETLTFTNERKNPQWLDGDHYSVNIFDGKNTVLTPFN